MKKIIFPLLTLGLVFSGTQVTNASSDSPTQEVTTLNSPVTAAVNSENVITPYATIVRVDKPIADKGTVTNYQLGQLINHYDNYSSWLRAVNAVIYAGVSAPAGVANSLATSFGGDGIEKLREAYYSGKNMYWVAVYANGVDPSLTTIHHRTFGTTPIIYIEDL